MYFHPCGPVRFPGREAAEEREAPSTPETREPDERSSAAVRLQHQGAAAAAGGATTQTDTHTDTHTFFMFYVFWKIFYRCNRRTSFNT